MKNSTYIPVLFFATALFINSCKSGSSVAHKPGEKSEITDDSRLRKAEFLFFNANKAKLVGNYDEAIGLFEKCINIDPKNDAAYYELARLYGSKHNLPKAITLAKKSLELSPGNKWYIDLIANLHLSNGEVENAITYFEKLAALEPEDLNHQFTLSGIYAQQGEFQKSIDQLNKIEESLGVIEEISFQKERLFMSLNEPENATEELEKLIQTNPENSAYYLRLARLYEQNKEEENALATYEKVLKMEPDNGLVLYGLSEYYRSKGEYTRADDYILQAFDGKYFGIDSKIKILSEYYDASQTLVNTTDEDREKRSKMAYELLEKTIEYHPEEAQAFAVYGDFLYRDKRLEEAAEKFQKAVELDKNKFSVWYQLVLVRYELGDYQKMLDNSQTAMELFPIQPIFYFFNGVALGQEKRNKEAIEVLNSGKEIVLANDGLLAQFYSTLGDNYHVLKDHENSDNSYEKALELEPDNSYVLNNYSYYLALRKEKLEKAKKMSARSNELEPNQPSFQDTYGWVLYQMNEYSEAETWIKKAIDSGTKSAEVMEHYGDILFKLNRLSEAIEYWKKAEALGGNSPTLTRKLSEGKLFE